MQPLVRDARYVCFGATVLALFALTVNVCAQSLDPQKPAPMKAGPNVGTVDNFGGANYFYFWSGPGETTVTATYRSMGLLGAAMQSELTIELYDENKTWVTRTKIASLKDTSQRQLHGTLKKETKLILAVIPPTGGLVISGGDYEVTATGAVRFDKPLSATDLIVGTYTPMLVYDNESTAVKFKSDGTLEFASGTLGNW